MAKPPRASGGVVAELGLVAQRPRPRPAAAPEGEAPARPPRPPVAELGETEDDGPDPYAEALRLKPRSRGGKGRGRKVRVYHRTGRGNQARCHAFTITRAAYERLLTDRVLDHRGATYPDGQPVVPKGGDPMDHAVRCGSCGTHSVECLQIEFEED